METAMRIMILVLGSRGDVQPLVALGAGLQRTRRHEVTIVTADDFEGFVRNQGWQVSQKAEAIIFSALGLGAYHIAEKQRVPCFWALPFPFFNRTRSFPNLVFPFLPLGGNYNLLAHIIVEQLAQQFVGRFVNRQADLRLRRSYEVKAPRK
jgi:hypothetical protein